MDQSRPEAVAERAVMDWAYLVSTQQTYDGLVRLVKRDDAILAWRNLAQKLPDNFYWVAARIGRSAVEAFLPPSAKLTSKENLESCIEAAELAERLCHLIESNDNLQPLHEMLTPRLQQAALYRVLGGLLAIHLHFPEDIEQQLDAREKRRREEDGDPLFMNRSGEQANLGTVCELPMVTTSDAYKILQGYWTTPAADFREQLKRFAIMARRAGTFTPLVPRPRSDKTDQHFLSLNICSTLDYYCGSPNHEIAAAFVSAIFDEDVATDTVKKWWQRRDISFR